MTSQHTLEQRTKNKKAYERTEAILIERPELSIVKACALTGIKQHVFNHYRNYKPTTKAEVATVVTNIDTLPNEMPRAMIIIAPTTSIKSIMRDFL